MIEFVWRIIIKKLAVVMAMVLVLCFAFTGCGEKQEEAVNPVTECSSMEEMNEMANTSITEPGVMGVSNESYAVIDCGEYMIAQYSFEVAGMEYSLRSANTLEDISGYHIGEQTAFEMFTEETAMQIANDDSAKLARWNNIAGQFVLQVNDNGEMDQADFESIAEEFEAACGDIPSTDASAYAGNYQDSTSQRASLEAVADGEKLNVTINWGDSADSEMVWTMTLSLSEDGLMYYSECTCKTVTYDEDGNATEEVKYTDGEGYFSPVDGKLLWDGDADDNCKECVFEIME